jgi:3D (Asp-Asp-Asp) domain-containing protein
MTYVRPSQLRATSKASLFKRLAGATLIATLSLSVLGPTRVARVCEAAAVTANAAWSVDEVFDLPAGTWAPELLRPATSARRRSGSDAMLASWSAPAAARGASVILMRVTAYCPCDICCGPKAMGITASGRPVVADHGRFVAADPVLPFGTRLVVPGYNGSSPVRVLDRGGAIRGRSLDVYFDSHERAREWGVRWLPVAILPGR